MITTMVKVGRNRGLSLEFRDALRVIARNEAI